MDISLTFKFIFSIVSFILSSSHSLVISLNDILLFHCDILYILGLSFILLVAIALVAVACKDVKIEENTTPVENVDPRNQIYLSAVSAGYQGTYEEWLNSIKGDAIELKVADGYIQMKYKQETAWTNLLQLETLTVAPPAL